MYTGVFPILPTPFDARGELDLASQKRAIDFLIAARVDGICILANYSEQFALEDSERELLTRLILEHVAGRVPVIVTTSHYSSRIAAARSRSAQELGAQMVMLMPPYHGATFRPPEAGVREFFQVVADAIDIPIMIQDAPVSGTLLSAALLASLAAEIPRIRYFKIEMPFAAAKLRELIRLGGVTIEGPFDGEESVTLLPDLEAGATGTMPSSLVPEVLGDIVRLFLGGSHEDARDLYDQYLPLIHYENRQCGLVATKVLMQEGGIIAHDTLRHPTPALHPATRAGLLKLARERDPLILRWGR
jgi:dihydrodipicolinate synthase/N-acetylneuraminate lyase